MRTIRNALGIALAVSLSSAVAAPITVRIEGVVTASNFFGRSAPASVLGTHFSAVYRVELSNAKYVVDQVDAVSEVFAASSQIGCRGVVGLSCIWNDGPGAPVITSYSISTAFGTFSGFPWALGFGDASGVMMNRGYPSIFPPDGNDTYAASKSQSLYLLSSNPETSAQWDETLFQRSWNLQLQAASNGSLFGDYRDFSQTPSLAAADSNYFFFNQFVNQTRTCTANGCTDPDRGLGSLTFEGNLTFISVPEAPTLLILLSALASILLALRRPIATGTRRSGR